MSILTSANSSSVERGYRYYQRDKVENIRQLNDEVFEGYVGGSLKNPYYVKIDIKRPKESHCDCPHANGNNTCKHMVALYFELFSDEVEKYESQANSEDKEYYDDYYDEDEYYYENRRNLIFEKPLFFDVVLEKFVTELTEEEMKRIIVTELNNNEQRTYDLYLKKNYENYLGENGQAFIFLDELNKKVHKLVDYCNYNDNDFDKEILDNIEKKKVVELYKDKSIRMDLEKILFNEKLAVYSDYNWLAHFYKNSKEKDEIERFCKLLNNHLDNLKHYSIKNSIPKSNILIAIYILSDFTISETSSLLLKNAKYLHYVDYVIWHSDDVLGLYEEFHKLISKNYFKNKIYIPEVLYRFDMVTSFENEEIRLTHNLYSYLCLGNIDYLKVLSHSLPENKVIDLIENKTKDTFLLMKLYIFYEKQEKLWNLLCNGNDRHLLLDNIDYLKDIYNDDLYNYFVSEFYNIIKQKKSRQIYRKACRYMKGISKLNRGEELVNEIIEELQRSEYKKCITLFEEIHKSLK